MRVSRQQQEQGMSDSRPQVGASCWAELQTSDAGGAKAFYTEFMGWEAPDDDIPGGGTYAMLRQGDGKILTPPMDIPGVGRFATMADPQGAVFAVIADLGT
jgi:predicted enzyme related to lactoylglutathione lyase